MSAAKLGIAVGLALLPVHAAAFVPGIAHYIADEDDTAGTLLTAGGAAWGSFLGSAVALGLSGAADAVTYVVVPVAVVSASSILALSIADLVGVFAPSATIMAGEPEERRVSIAYLWAFDPILEEERFVRIATELRKSEYELGASHDKGVDADYSTTSLRLAAHMSELLLGELAIGRDVARADSYEVLRLAPRVRLRYDMARLGPSLARLEHELYVGTFYETTTYDLGDLGEEKDHSNGISAGAELRWLPRDTVEILAGYAHDRTGVAGGTASGFFGNFYAGARANVFEKAWLFARAEAGSPNVYQLGSEVRW